MKATHLLNPPKNAFKFKFFQAALYQTTVNVSLPNVFELDVI